MPKIVLHRGEERRLKGGHPWVYRGEIARQSEGLVDGDTVAVLDSRDRLLGTGFFSAEGSIAVRVLWPERCEFDAAWFGAAFLRAREHRRWLGHDPNACRMIHSEGDGLSGLIVDAYGDGLVLVTGSSGMRRRLDAITSALEEVFNPRWILDRETGALRGEVPERVEFREGPARFEADPRRGQKTGWFLDQRANRLMASAYAKNGEALDLFCYHGGLAVQAALAGAQQVVGVEISADAAANAARQAERNGVADRCRFITANAFDWLKAHEKDGRIYDLVWLDPPAFTKSRESIESASRGYKEINLRALKRVKEGGVLVTSSCSYHMPAGLFRDLVAQAASDAGRRLRLLAERTQDTDHVIDPCVRETQYLKCLFFRVGGA